MDFRLLATTLAALAVLFVAAHAHADERSRSFGRHRAVGVVARAAQPHFAWAPDRIARRSVSNAVVWSVTPTLTHSTSRAVAERDGIELIGVERNLQRTNAAR
jgi:hypothetical protein